MGHRRAGHGTGQIGHMVAQQRHFKAQPLGVLSAVLDGRKGFMPLGGEMMRACQGVQIGGGQAVFGQGQAAGLQFLVHLAQVGVVGADQAGQQAVQVGWVICAGRDGDGGGQAGGKGQAGGEFGHVLRAATGDQVGGHQQQAAAVAGKQAQQVLAGGAPRCCHVGQRGAITQSRSDSVART